MFDPTAMIMSGKATKHHVLSARPTAPVVRDRPPRQRLDTPRRMTVLALRRLADRLEPRRVNATAPTS